MNLINKTFLIDTFDKVLKSGDLQKLVNVKKSESNILEEHLISMSITSEQHKSISSLNIDEKIEKIDQSQKRIDSTISELNKELVGLNKTISTIKKQKVIVKKVYDEKINRVDELNDAQLDSFFSDRY